MPSAPLSPKHHTTTFHLHDSSSILYESYTFGSTQMQALCQAVYAAVESLDCIPDSHLIVWIRPKMITTLMLSLHTHRDSHISHDTHVLLTLFLERSITNTLDFHYYGTDWKASPSKAHSATLIPAHTALPPLLPINLNPKAIM
jgi:hypothetical protein